MSSAHKKTPEIAPKKAVFHSVAIATIAIFQLANAPVAVSMQFSKIDLGKVTDKIGGQKKPAATRSSANTGGDARQKRKEERRQKEAVAAVFSEISKFNPTASFLRDKDAALQETKRQVKDFRARMDATLTPDLIKMANDPSNRKLVSVTRRMENWAAFQEREISQIDTNRILSESDEKVMLMRYMRAFFIGERLQHLQKMYPDKPEVRSAAAAGNRLLAQLGTIEDIEAKGKANRAAKIAKTRIYPARRRNAALERDFARAFKGSIWTQKEFKNSQILKLNLTSSGWSVERNEITGVILSRDQQASLAVKTVDGKCHSYLVLFEQKYQGGGRYGGSYMRSGNNQEMLCENVPK